MNKFKKLYVGERRRKITEQEHNLHEVKQELLNTTLQTSSLRECYNILLIMLFTHYKG
jgi:hypothetical protein